VKICYKPPVNTDKVITYVTKYRKDGETDWKSMPETTNLTETITGLDENSFYEITVAARYVGGHWGPPTDPLRVKTESLTTGKCCFSVLKVLQESRAIAWTTSRYVLNFTTASCGLYHSMAFLYRPTSATIQMLQLHTVR